MSEQKCPRPGWKGRTRGEVKSLDCCSLLPSVNRSALGTRFFFRSFEKRQSGRDRKRDRKRERERERERKRERQQKERGRSRETGRFFARVSAAFRYFRCPCDRFVATVPFLERPLSLDDARTGNRITCTRMIDATPKGLCTCLSSFASV